jgi:hypothetical protein
MEHHSGKKSSCYHALEPRETNIRWQLGQFSTFHLGAVTAERSHNTRGWIVIHTKVDPANGLFAHIAGCL